MTISERIFELIRERGYSQKEFSKKTGIAESTISDWKKKGTNPVSDKILIICEVLEVTPYYLLSGIENNDKRSREGKAPAAKPAPEKAKAEVKKAEPAGSDEKKADEKKAADKKPAEKKTAEKKAKEAKPAAKTKDDVDVRLPNIATVAKDDDDYHIGRADGSDKKADKKDKKKKKDKDKDKDKKKKKDKDKKKKKGYLITY